MPNIAVNGSEVFLPKVGVNAKIIATSTHKADGKNIALDGDKAVYQCPKHDNRTEYAVVHASIVHKADGKRIVVVGDKADYCSGSDGVVISGSSHSGV